MMEGFASDGGAEVGGGEGIATTEGHGKVAVYTVAFTSLNRGEILSVDGRHRKEESVAV